MTKAKKPITDPGEDALKEAFSRMKDVDNNIINNSSSKHAKLKLTKEEVERFEKAFEQKEFRDLMAQYASEISDPKHRAEQDEYIRQLEGQNEVPPGKDIIRPEPGFVIKFKFLKMRKQEKDKKSRGTSSSTKQCTTRINTTEKLFVNVVHSKFVAQPTYGATETKNSNGKVGRNWCIPYTLGPMRMEADNRNSLTPTFDCCFHPLSLLYSSKNVSFRDMIASTIIQGTTQQFKAVDEDIVIDQNYHIIKGTQYKNGIPPAMIIDKKKDAEIVSLDGSSSEDQPPTITNNDDDGRSIEKQEVIAKKTNDKRASTSQQSKLIATKKSGSSSIKKGFLLHSKTSSKLIKKAKNESKTSSIFNKGGGNTKDGNIIPHYEMIERGEFELADHTIQGLNQPSSRPKQLILRVNLPSIKSPKYVSLDVSEERLVLKSLDTKPFYHLNLKLPYPVLNEEGSARFDKEKHVLTITIPVCRPEIVICHSDHPDHPDNTEEDDANCKVGCDELEKNNVEKNENDKHPTGTTTTTKSNSPIAVKKDVDHLNDSPVIVSKPSFDHSRWLDTTTATTSNESRNRRKDFARDAALPTMPTSKPSSTEPAKEQTNSCDATTATKKSKEDKQSVMKGESSNIDCDGSFEFVEHTTPTTEKTLDKAENNDTSSAAASLYCKSQLIFELD